MTKGKIVLVPFPFDDLSTAKVRPALCLTDPVGPYRHIVLAFITSRVPPDLFETDLVLDSHQPGFTATGLRVSSIVQLHRMMTISASLILRELGELSSELQDQSAKSSANCSRCPSRRKESAALRRGPMLSPASQQGGKHIGRVGTCSSGCEHQSTSRAARVRFERAASQVSRRSCSLAACCRGLAPQARCRAAEAAVSRAWP